jgi:acetylornithine deacetylase/succinyl-diaminopimelate desuccinylase-like protein
MASRDGAIGRALTFFDGNGFRDRLAALVAIPSTSQDPVHLPDVQRYLADAIRPWLETLGFIVEIHPNPREGFGPILVAERIENPALPTVLTYGHGDTVRGLEEQWTPGLDPWTLTERGELWYGRGTADNKGQHAVNLSALAAVLEERGGKLGFNLKLVLETSEERGSTGLREFVAANREKLAADVLIASDGPRVMPEVPTIATGTRGTYHFDLVVDLRAGGVHSCWSPRWERSSTATEKSSCGTGCRATACRRMCERCWPDVRSAAVEKRPRSIPVGANLA